MAEFLLELLCEELPLWAQQSGRRELKTRICTRLQELGFFQEDTEARDFATPRRLSLAVAGLRAEIPPRQERRRGPRASAPEKAILGFCKSAGVRRDSLQQEGEYLYAVLESAGEALAHAVARIVPQVVVALPWQKSMRWGTGEMSFPRPLRSILCLADGRAVAFEIDGLPGVTSGNVTRGHRVLSPDVFEVAGIRDYEEKLSANKVILDSQERQERILRAGRELAAAEGVRLLEDSRLLEEAAAATEWPVPLLCAIEREHMRLPREVLLQVICGQQRYFATCGKDGDVLAPFCVAVADVEAVDGGAAIRQGNERVLRARLGDAEFFFKKDLAQWQCPKGKDARDWQNEFYERNLEKLGNIAFYGGVSMGDKVKHMLQVMYRCLSVSLQDENYRDVYAAFQFSKIDLISEMVREFPALQGIMGGHYADRAGLSKATATAIKEQYLPQGPDDPIPATKEGRRLAMADKLVTLACLWPDAKARPSGAGDPYGLRRAALGVIRIALESEDAFSAHSSMSRMFVSLFQICGVQISHESLQEFFIERLKVHLRQRKGLRPDVVEAVLFHSDVLLEIYKRAVVLTAFFPDTEDGKALLQGYKRAANILRAENVPPDAPLPDENALRERAEKELFAETEEAQLNMKNAMRAHQFQEEEYRRAVESCAALRAPIDAFFDQVRVNVEDAGLRENRLCLLRHTCRTLERVADFSKISDK